MASFNSSSRNDQYHQLGAQIRQKFQDNRQTSEVFDRKNRWRKEIEDLVKTVYPSCRLVLSGSSANGFGSIHSDIDLVLCFEGVAVTGPSMLRRIESLFTSNRRRFQTEVIPSARVPIIKLKDRERSFETDISVENWTSVKNAFVLKCYSECDPRVKPLVMAIKLWAQRAGITDAKLKRLAGFAVVLLVIHYLQAGCTPSVVPALQQMFPAVFQASNSIIIDKLTSDDVPAQIRAFSSGNKQSLGELVVGFFQYYSTFNWSRTMSIRSGNTRPTSTYDKIWQRPCIRLEDPSDGGNVARSVYDSYEFSRIKSAFSSALSRLRRNPSLEEIL
ncbi:poly(A) RNA polymerase GLD2-B-like [Stylophora pistillata]|uniref:poly(A) RNA polymerase GLD2-B-like n=1 Tax=Stylophora pistillata TaxID=50429 RepID=UPI000C03A49C|nr:poly(A) RNA polymerase GLD2-B-like [Stylophora pistillata]